MNNQNIWVVFETENAAPKRVSLELTAKAKELAKGRGEKAVAVIIDPAPDTAIKAAFSAGADEVLAVEQKTCFEGEAYILEKLMAKYEPLAVLICSTPMGSDLSGALSARSGAGIAVNCTDIIPTDDGILYIRPSYDGKLNASIQIGTYPSIGTFKAGTFKAAQSDEHADGPVTREEVEIPASVLLTEFLGFRPDDELLKTNIEDADILISGGRGVGSKEGFEELFTLAKLVGGNVSGSRAAVEEGWIEKDRQVGITGKTVTPKLYVALGISGQTPHIAGMKGSDVIVAVNTNPQAEIFQFANYGLVADLHEVVPELIRRFSEQ